MNNKQKKVVKGLANIGALLDRAEIPAESPAPTRERRDINGIFHHTREKIMAAIPPMVASDHVSHRALFETFLLAGLRDSYNLGHAEALEQNGSVEKLLIEQYRVRTEVTMPAVVCGIMEQSGLESMTLDMARMATVFDRLDVDYTYDQDTEIMSYTVRPAGAINVDADQFDGEPLADPALLAEAHKYAAQTRLDDDIRHQVEDIEQTDQNGVRHDEFGYEGDQE